MADKKITIKNMKYDPNPCQIEDGDRVYWVNEDGMNHTATAEDGSFDSGYLPKKGWTSGCFKVEKTTTYKCLVHEDMKGVIEVEP